MGILSVIAIVLLIGAFLGFIFSSKGNEGSAAVSGAKTAGGCLISFIVLLVIAVIVIVLLFLV